MARIAATGAYNPVSIVTNDFFKNHDNPVKFSEIGKFMTGMHERRHANPNETGVYMAYMAAKAAIERSGYEAKDVDLIVGNITPNQYLEPEDINIVAGKLGCSNAVVIPIRTACSSFLTGLNLASTFLKVGTKKIALVVNSTNSVNHIVDQTRDYSMFGDGAGAVLLDNKDRSYIGMEEASDFSVFHTMHIKSPVFTHQREFLTIEADPNVDMIENQVIKPIDVAKRLLDKVKIEPDWFIAHQAGIGMLECWRRKLKLGKSKLKHTFDKFANMMSANIPVTLDFHVRNNEIKRGDHILFFAPAAGSHYISILWKY
jgi:3-oxoacyl-[acyl-carrier-protein] synthase-3